MATPKFDRILQEFSRRIGDRLVSAFTPGGGVYPEGTSLAAVDAIAYVNKALHSFHGDIWMQQAGSKEGFINVFPELASAPRSITFTGGVYTIANPNLDFLTIYSAYLSGIPIAPVRIAKEEDLPILLADKYPLHGPTADKPILCPAGNKLYIFPSAITTVQCQFILQPLDPTTGAFLTQNGSYDSPYYDNRNSQIATIAEQHYWAEKEPKP